MATIQEKQRAFLAPFIDRGRAALTDGVRTLRWMRHPQAAYIADELTVTRSTP